MCEHTVSNLFVSANGQNDTHKFADFFKIRRGEKNEMGDSKRWDKIKGIKEQR